MIRLILKTTFQDEHNGCSGEEFETFDIENDKLEEIITRGGRSESAHLRTQLIGCEVVEIPEANVKDLPSP